jgi:2-polyprenyl-3-methyl-5-hydroxy-6-metoxy-1,4-benzoquinol methylase
VRARDVTTDRTIAVDPREELKNEDRHSAGTDELTTRSHWEAAWAAPPRWRLPSPLVVTTRNIQRILRSRIRPGMRVLELGCAPGKILAWAAADLRANVCGLDYSERGITWSRMLFAALRLPADLRCEDVFATTFAHGTFDVVYSSGLIEHFEDPKHIVRTHVELAKPGGRAVIAIPDYSGIYGRLQQWCDPANLAIHNTEIMSPEALAQLAPGDLTAEARTYRAGRFSPWQISFDRRLPAPIGAALASVLNGVALLQPVDIAAICPLLVLEITRRVNDAC